MDNVKGILLSKTVWASMVGLLAFILHTFNLGDIDQTAWVDAVSQIITGVSFLAAAVFRITATHKLL